MTEPVDPYSFLLKRIESVENKLDQLVDLLQSVTTLNEKIAHNEEQIRELKVRDREITHQVEVLEGRIHNAVDKQVGELNNSKEYSANLLKQHENEAKVEFIKIKESIAENKAEVQKWINRATGAWVILGGCLMLLQAFGGYIINNINKEHEELLKEVKEIRVHDREVERRLDILYGSTKKE